MTSAPRCTLQHLFSEPGVLVRGYGADGRVAVTGTSFVIGRLETCEIQIVASIGGRNTYALRRRDPDWIFHVENEWARARLNGGELAGDGAQGRFPQRVLHAGDVIEILTMRGDVVHRFRVELA